MRQVRKHRSAAEKRRIVEQTLVPGASVARVAQSHGVNANVVFHWRRQYRERKLAETGLIPVVVIGEAPVKQVPLPASSGTIRIELPCGAVVSVEGSADLTLVRAIVESLRA